MSKNKEVEKYIGNNSYSFSLKKEDIPIKKNLSEFSSENDWPKHPCISCKWWVALSPEMNLGECRSSLPRLGKVKEKPEFAITPPNCFCKYHWGRNNDILTYTGKSVK